MKKICLLLPNLSGGGAQRVLTNLANNFVNHNVSVDLVLVNNKGPYLKSIDKRVNIINLNRGRVLFSIFSLVRYFRVKQPDAVLVTIHHMSIIAIIARMISMVDFRLIVRQPNYLSKTVPQNFLTRYYLIMVRYMFNKSDGVIGISQGVSDDLMFNGIKNVRTIYNPLDYRQINNMVYDNNLKVVHPLIIGVGRLEKQKNFSLLIKAFSIIAKNIDAQLLILGEGSLRDELEKEVLYLKISSRVNFLGFVDNPYLYMRSADVFVLSSLWEGFGNVIVESLACGTQVVSTDCPSGPSEILDGGKYGRLAESGNPKDLAEKIVDSINNPMDKKILIKRSKDFSINKISKKYIDTLL